LLLTNVNKLSSMFANMVEIDIITMVMELVGGMIDQAFAFADSSVLQEWANDMIFKAADHSQEVTREQLGVTPDLIPKEGFELDFFS